MIVCVPNFRSSNWRKVKEEADFGFWQSSLQLSLIIQDDPGNQLSFKVFWNFQMKKVQSAFKITKAGMELYG